MRGRVDGEAQGTLGPCGIYASKTMQMGAESVGARWECHW